MVVRTVSCLFTQSLTAMEVTTTVGSLIVLAQRIPKLLESPLAMARVPWYVPQTAGVSMEEWATGAEENQRTRMSLVDSRCHHLLHLRQQMLLPLMQRRSEAYADVNGIPSTYAYAMMSWLREEPMAEHVAVEFWSGSTCPGKYLESLLRNVLKSLDGYERILSVWRPKDLCC